MAKPSDRSAERRLVCPEPAHYPVRFSLTLARMGG